MDRNIDWPWSWEEEIEWKADLEERDYDFIEELIDSTVDESESVSGYIPESIPEEALEDAIFERFCVMA